MKSILLLVILFSNLALASEEVKVATFDSGFGGFFTTKEIEKEARKLTLTHDVKFTLTHYGDTKNAPYGEKTPEQISTLASKGVGTAFTDGAEEVFIACNTASTQFAPIKEILGKGKSDHVISIIESSVTELKRLIDEKLKKESVVRVAILATPFTVRNMIYPKALAKAYGIAEPVANLNMSEDKRWYVQKGGTTPVITSVNTFALPGKKKIEVHQLGPGNWVEMIEYGAPADIQQMMVEKDMKRLSPSKPYDVVGEFCTHFPVFDPFIKAKGIENKITSKETSYIQQGPLMARIFRERMLVRLEKHKRKTDLKEIDKAALTPAIYISGDNLDETRELSQNVFPHDPLPMVKKKDF